MRVRLPWCILGLLCFATEPLWAHGGGHRTSPPAPQPPPPPPFRPPSGSVPPGLRTPHDPPAPDTPPPDDPPPTPAPPDTPTTPGGDPNPAPDVPHDPGDTGGPQTPTPTPQAPPVPQGPNQRPATRKGGRPGRTTGATSWRVWWEYNREHLFGLRKRMRRPGVTTGVASRGPVDPLKGRRPEVRNALRAIAAGPRTHGKLKAAALIALGRVAVEEDVEAFLLPLRRSTDPDVRSAAALGLGLAPPVGDAALRQRVRDHLEYLAGGAGNPDYRVRGFAYVALGLRARHDKTLAMGLARQSTAIYPKSAYDAATLAYACGIARDDVLLPELMLAARKGRLGGQKLGDVGRSHAAAGLGLIRSPLVVDTLARLLRSRRAGVETRRAAALSLGRMLRGNALDADDRDTAKQALLRAWDKGRDSVLRGFCAIALGGARPPLATRRLADTLDRGGDLVVRHYAALALGLAAPHVDADETKRIRRTLLRELEKSRDPELSAALAIAVGLSGNVDAVEPLLERVRSSSLASPVRGACAEALGLLGQPSRVTSDALLEALRTGPPELVEGATLGLGLLGRRGITKEIVERLKKTSSGTQQGRFTLALGHLGRASTVDPLLALLRDTRLKRVVRELAAVALGLLGADAERDVLFELDAHYNYYATTVVTHELLTIF